MGRPRNAAPQDPSSLKGAHGTLGRVGTPEVQPFDSIATAAVAAELSALLCGSRVEKIQQPDRLEVVWTLRGKGARRLLFSARGPFSRVVLTRRQMPAPARAPGFCMLLRKYLEGGRVRRVVQLGLERALAVEVDSRDELGDPVVRTFLAELTGNHSNLILLDGPIDRTPIILAALRPVTEGMSRVRQILPSLAYAPPPIDPARHDPREGSVRAAISRGGSLEKALHGYFHSLSRHAVRQILQTAGLSGDRPVSDLMPAEIDRLESAWSAAMQHLQEGRFFPRLVVGQAWDYALLPADLADGTGPAGHPDAGVSALLDEYYASRWEEREAEALRLMLLRTIAGEQARLQARIAQARETLSRAESAAEYKRWGDLLLTWQFQVARGATTATLPDPETGELVVVPIDPGRSPADNARRHYVAYKKALSARRIQERMLEEAEAELGWWAQLAAEVEAADSKAALESIAALVSGDTGTTAGSERPGAAAGPERYRSSDGLEILVGRNNRQNDLLTSRLARPEDWWFHAQKAPGSHVIVRAPASGASLPERTCFQAAQLAAWYSRARSDTRVPVAYTRRKHVRRKPGAAPGFVTYDHERIVVVQPDEAEIAALVRLS